MMRIKLSLVLLASLTASASVFAQGPLDPAKLMLQPTDTWPMYNGDYSGRRFSPLAKINEKTVKNLQLAWTYRAEGPPALRSARIEATPLQVNGVLYFTVPTMVWAVDARTGVQLWNFHWNNKGGNLIGNRGVAMYKDTLYFETADCNLVALDSATGKEKWHSPIGNLEEMYYASTAPMVVKDHVIVGISGDDFDIPGYLESHDLETGKLQWRWYSHPNPGDPEAASWPDEDSMMHGGGMTWVPGTYDPALNLYYVGTGKRSARHRGCLQGRLESLYRQHRRAQSGHRKARLVLSSRTRTTPTIGMRSRRRSFSMAQSTVSLANCSRRPAATAGSS